MKKYKVLDYIFLISVLANLTFSIVGLFVFDIFSFGFISATIATFFEVSASDLALIWIANVIILPLITYLFYSNKILSIVSLAVYVIDMGFTIFSLTNNLIEKTKELMGCKTVLWQISVLFDVIFITLLLLRIINGPMRLPKAPKRKLDDTFLESGSDGEKVLQEYNNKNDNVL